MPSPLAQHLADRFASDARALRARAAALKAAGAPGRGVPRPAGPGVASTERMAGACDRVEALFADVEDDAAARTLLPALAGLVAGAGSDDERHVYAGAVARLSDALGRADGGGAGDADEDDPDDDPDDDFEDDA